VRGRRSTYATPSSGEPSGAIDRGEGRSQGHHGCAEFMQTVDTHWAKRESPRPAVREMYR